MSTRARCSAASFGSHYRYSRKGWLSKTAAYLGNAGRDLAVEIGATAINRQMGM
jgi:hypothetical protein